MTKTAAFSKFWSLGFRSLVPITPPGAAVSEKSTLAKRPGSIGKAVGIRGGDGLWRGFDWVKHHTSATDIEAWAEMGAGVGIRTGDGIIAIDADTFNAKYVEEIAKAAKALLGDAPVRIGNPPKFLLLYAVSEPVAYQRVLFDDGLPFRPGAEPRVEMLSDGRQFVADGIHPSTGKPYTWPGRGLWPRDKLTTVTPQQLNAFFARLTEILPAAARVETTAANDRSNIDQASLEGDSKTVEAAVRALPNTTELFPTYDDYIRVGAAIKGAAQGLPDHGLALFLEWAERWSGGNDLERAAADFARIKPPYELGARWLYEMADSHGKGAFRHADVWFEPLAEVELNPFEAARLKQAEETRIEPIRWIRPSEWKGRTPPDREWEVEGWIPKGEVTLLYGDGGIGKTLLAHQYATAAAAGVSWLGLNTRQAKVMCFFCEDSEAELHRRQIDINNALCLDYDQADANLRIASRKYMDNLFILWDRNTGAMKRQAVWAQLLEDAVAFGAEVIVVDTIADTYGGSEIDRGQVNAFVKSCLGRLASEIQGSIIALGHPSIAGKTEGRSGSTAWSNAARSRLFLRYPKNVEKGDIRELEGMKLNYGPKGSLLKLQWKRGAFDVLAGSTAGTVHLNALNDPKTAPAFERIEDMAERAVLAAVAAAEAEGVALGASSRSPVYAPRVLKQREPEALAVYTAEEVETALRSLERRGLVQAKEVARRGNRHPVMGYAVVRQKPEAADNLSEGSGVFQ